MAIVAFWLALIFFVGCLAMVWWLLLVDHGDLTEEPYEGEQEDNPLAGADGVSVVVLQRSTWIERPLHSCSAAGSGLRVVVFCNRQLLHLCERRGS